MPTFDCRNQQEELGRRFEEIVRGDRDLAHLLAAARELALPQWRIVAGFPYQTVWNVLTNKPVRTGIKDYDLIYFDDADLSCNVHLSDAMGQADAPL